MVDYETEFQSTVRALVSTLQLAEGDEYGILTALPNLAFAYKHVRKTPPKNICSVVALTTLSIWLLVQGLIVIVNSRKFSPLRLFTYFLYNLAISTEEGYRLVASAGNPDAESDTLVTIPSATIDYKIQEQSLSCQGNPTILQHLYWSTHGGDADDDFSIIGFAGEFKENDNDCNKIMVLATAQAQRKALGLKPAIIMGAVACRGQVQIFSSFWTSDKSVCSWLCISCQKFITFLVRLHLWARATV